MISSFVYIIEKLHKPVAVSQSIRVLEEETVLAWPERSAVVQQWAVVIVVCYDYYEQYKLHIKFF